MKKLIFVLTLALTLLACKEEAPKDYVTLSGTITNQNSDSLIVAQRSILKTIKVDAEGKFSDTLKVETGSYILYDGKNRIDVYLKNGFDLQIMADTEQLGESLKFEGEGATPNNYLSEKAVLSKSLIDFPKLMDLDKTNFDKELSSMHSKFQAALDNTKGLDSAFIAAQKNEMEGMKKQLAGFYEQKQELKALDGQESPKFVNYENNAGGSTSLDDLKGKYVYIDVWATWCGPCKAEIPHLKEVEKAYHDKNIEFVSISIDKEKDYDKWKAMITEKELGGIQLLADSDWKSRFVTDYKIKGIPRFILIDPQGKIVSSDAPRPSDDRLKELFNELKI